MKKKVEYHSTDKLYNVNTNTISKNLWLVSGAIAVVCLLFLTVICFRQAIDFESKITAVNYSENGNVDYKIYLKDNNYYSGSYLNSGMKYIASLIKTVNVNFDYQMHSDKTLDYNYKYKIVADLQITDKDDPTKILYSRPEVLLKDTTSSVTNNSFAISEEIDIDYDKYNNYVNSFKRDYGLVINSNLIITLYVEANGSSNLSDDILAKDNQLKIIIPLSEQTIDINMNTDNVNESGVLTMDVKTKVNNPILLSFSIVSLVLALVTLWSVISLYRKYYKSDIYRSKVNKILREYDRLIVTGKTDIKEKDYSTKFYPDTFEEMVDVSQNLNSPILYYEVIPGEKCFFVVVKDNILYKYRLTRAYLEKERSELKNLEEVKEEKNSKKEENKKKSSK